MTREAWLLKASAKLSDQVHACSGYRVPLIYVSVGWPKGARGGKGGKIRGQCWAPNLSADKRPHLFIAPTESDPLVVLAVLLHELLHAAVGTHHGHKGAFRKAALACGLLAPVTTATPDDSLTERLNALRLELGPYPHAALTPLETGKKKGSRLRLWECPCGVKARVASDDFQATCRKCGGPFLADGKED